MRNLNSHIVPADVPQNQLRVMATDQPGPGGAHYFYEIGWGNGPDDVSKTNPTIIKFQSGPIKEVGINGITNEALLAIVEDRLKCFQAGPFSCRKNAIALTHVQEALMWLQKRTV